MNIKDYLHLYLSCEILIEPYEDQPAYIDTIDGICVGESVNFKKASDYYFDDLNDFDIKPLLHPLSDMTDEECDEFGIASDGGEYLYGCFEPDAVYGGWMAHIEISSVSERLNEMRKRGFDCDGLIEAGLAIDKTKLDAK